MWYPVRVRGLIALALAASTTVTAAAQERSESADAAARQLWEDGVAAAQEQRWEDAFRAFQRAYAVSPRMSILLNLAAAQAETGRLVGAAESYRRFLAGAQSGPEARYRETAQEALAEIEARTPALVIAVDGLAPGDEVVLDDAALSAGALGLELPVDPGAHRVLVRRDGTPVAHADVTVAERERREVTMSVEAPMAGEEAPARGEEDGSLLSSPWLWTGVGAIVVAALVVIVAVAAAPDDPFVGNFGGGTVTFE